jgi:hypothetical protein
MAVADILPSILIITLVYFLIRWIRSPRTSSSLLRFYPNVSRVAMLSYVKLESALDLKEC